MLYLSVKALISGLLAATVSEIAKRSPAFGALVASLPLISIMAVIWLWRDTGDNERIASQMEATFWYVLPSLPMFLLMPSMLPSDKDNIKQGVGGDAGIRTLDTPLGRITV